MNDCQGHAVVLHPTPGTQVLCIIRDTFIASRVRRRRTVLALSALVAWISATRILSNVRTLPQVSPLATNRGAGKTGHRFHSDGTDSGTATSGEVPNTSPARLSPLSTPRSNYLDYPTEKTIPPGRHSNIPPPHSRIGPDGEKAYVHDPLFLRANPKPFLIRDVARTCRPAGEAWESPKGVPELTKIRNYIQRSKRNATGDKGVKLFCSIYTYEGGMPWTDAVSETWGRRCDGMLFASSISNETAGHVHLPSNSSAGFRYKGMTQRTRTIFAYLYDNFLNEYDYYHFSGDDVYLVVENLKVFLGSDKVRSWEAKQGNLVFAGFWLQWGKAAKTGPPDTHYLGGGSGYTMSRKALKAYVEGPLQSCDVYYDRPNEDVHVSNCFREHLTGEWIDTRDDKGAHRYHQLPIERHANFPDRKYGFSTQMIKQSLKYLNRSYGFPIVLQSKYISESSVAFHKLYNPDEMRRYDMFLYGTGLFQCGDNFTLG